MTRWILGRHADRYMAVCGAVVLAASLTGLQERGIAGLRAQWRRDGCEHETCGVSGLWMGAAVAHSLNPASGGLSKSEYEAGKWIIYKAADGRRIRGQIVGPDQDYFPSPLAVFVSFSSGFTHLVNIECLELEG